jgi:hypothetical protein
MHGKSVIVSKNSFIKADYKNSANKISDVQWSAGILKSLDICYWRIFLYPSFEFDLMQVKCLLCCDGLAWQAPTFQVFCLASLFKMDNTLDGSSPVSSISHR